MADLPPCGIYRTTIELDGVPADRLVYFHNHGEPGPGIYLPESWSLNRARFSERGTTLSPGQVRTLAVLPAEGLYKVTEELTCCAEAHRTFARGMLVQLGYNGQATPILFVPEWTASGLTFPERGQALDADRLRKLERLTVVEPTHTPPPARLVVTVPSGELN